MPCTQFDKATMAGQVQSGFRSPQNGARGYYAVTLEDHAIRAELTTTPRVGVHRYRLETPDTLTWIVDLEHRDDLVHYSIEPRGSRMLVGHRVSKNWAEEQHVLRDEVRPGLQLGRSIGRHLQIRHVADGTLAQEMTMVPVFVADFGVVSELNVHVALSFATSKGPLPIWRPRPRLWVRHAFGPKPSAMGQPTRPHRSEGWHPSDRTTFYTALYHATTVPNLASDVDGRYRGTDLQVHQLNPNEGDHYTVFSLWDTYRALHPLGVDRTDQNQGHGAHHAPDAAKADSCPCGNWPRITRAA